MQLLEIKLSISAEQFPSNLAGSVNAKGENLGETSLLKDCLKCSYKWLGKLLCRSMF